MTAELEGIEREVATPQPVRAGFSNKALGRAQGTRAPQSDACDTQIAHQAGKTMSNNTEAIYEFNQKLAAWTQAHPQKEYVVAGASLTAASVLGPMLKPKKHVYDFSIKKCEISNTVLGPTVEVVINSHTYTNQLPVPQTFTFSAGEEQVDTATMSFHAGAKLTSELSASILIVSGTFSGQLTFGMSTTSTLQRRKKWEGVWPIVVPPNTNVRVHGVIKRTTFSAQFTVTYQVGLTAYGLTVTGGKSLAELFPGFVPELEATGQVEGGLGIDIDTQVLPV